MAMTTPEKQATRIFTVIMLVLMIGLAVYAWHADGDWRTVLIPIGFGIVGIPLGILKGRYLLRSLVGGNRR